MIKTSIEDLSKKGRMKRAIVSIVVSSCQNLLLEVQVDEVGLTEEELKLALSIKDDFLQKLCFSSHVELSSSIGEAFRVYYLNGKPE